MSRWPARVIQKVGTRLLLRLTWGHDCPNSHGQGKVGPHHGSELHGVYRMEETLPALMEIPVEHWPIRCEHCTATAPAPGEGQRALVERAHWDTPSGEIEPGGMFLVTTDMEVHAPGESCGYGWTNCDGKHWICRLPCGGGWEMQGPASNCTRRDDKQHRCWVVHFDADGVPYHVDKDGDTCGAGAGSIQSPGWHGFFCNGALTLTLTQEPRR